MAEKETKEEEFVPNPDEAVEGAKLTLDADTGEVKVQDGSGKTHVPEGLQLLSLAGNSATLGAVPLVTGLFSKEKKRKQLDFLDQAREDNPVAGPIAEVAGGFLTPMPGLGVIKGVSTLGKIAAGAGRGALAGGATSAISDLGSQRGDSLDFKQALMSGLKGAGGGAIFGGGASTLASRFGGEASRFAAGGGTAGKIKDIAKSVPAKLETGMEHAKDVARIAEEQRWIGHKPTDTFQTSAARALRAAESEGEKIGEILAKHEKKGKIPFDDFLKNTVFPVMDDAVSGHVTGTPQAKAMETMLDEVNQLTSQMRRQATGSHDIPMVSVKDMFNFRQQLRKGIWGSYGENPLADKATKQMMAKLSSNISNLENEVVSHVSRLDGDKLIRSKELVNAAKHWSLMATKGDIADMGLVETLLGRGIRGMGDAALLQHLGVPMPVARMGAGALGHGRIPNASVWLGRHFANQPKRNMFNPFGAGHGTAGAVNAVKTAKQAMDVNLDLD